MKTSLFTLFAFFSVLFTPIGYASAMSVADGAIECPLDLVGVYRDPEGYYGPTTVSQGSNGALYISYVNPAGQLVYKFQATFTLEPCTVYSLVTRDDGSFYGVAIRRNSNGTYDTITSSFLPNGTPEWTYTNSVEKD